VYSTEILSNTATIRESILPFSVSGGQKPTVASCIMLFRFPSILCFPVFRSLLSYLPYSLSPVPLISRPPYCCTSARPSLRKRLGVFLLPSQWNASPSQGNPQYYIRRSPCLHLGEERHSKELVSSPSTQQDVSGQGSNLYRSLRSRTC